MAIDYKKELEAAAKGMILVHEPHLLIKMIARMIVQKVRVSHAGILLHHKDRDTYILTVSRGTPGLKIPAGFARIDADNSLVRLFRERRYKQFLAEGALVYGQAKNLLRKKLNSETKHLLRNTLYQMEILEAVVCIPSYFRDDLLGILLLGRKKRGSFGRGELDFFVALASDVAMAVRNAQLFSDLPLELDKNKRLFIHTTNALAAAIDAKDHYTRGHTARVTELSLNIARKIIQKNRKSVDEKFLESLRIAGLLHDIGKIGIPEAILNKAEPLDETEKKRIQEHPAIGVSILEPIKELEDAILGVKYHHEKFDGTGYPDGLKGNEIPLIASVIAVADSFDAMTTDRPYRRGMSKEEAVQEIRRVSGKQLNPEASLAFIELYEEGKI
jgi:putative nucleotidyltransferase with HDIG domain